MATKDLAELKREFIDMGKEMNLEGQGLLDFVDKSLTEVEKREEREKERQQLSIQLAQITEKEGAREAELEKERVLSQERVTIRLAELKAKEEGRDEDGARGGDPFKGGIFHIKLQPFNEEKDTMESFLNSFESMAKSQKWPDNQLAEYLRSLLSGEALQTITGMNPPDQLDFSLVKAALMRKFNLTPEGFRYRFRTLRPGKDETPEQFSSKLGTLADRWVELSKINPTYDDLLDLMKREQFVRCCGGNLTAYLRERECKTMKEIEKSAMVYIEAHGLKTFTETSGNTSKSTGSGSRYKFNRGGYRGSGSYRGGHTSGPAPRGGGTPVRSDPSGNPPSSSSSNRGGGL